MRPKNHEQEPEALTLLLFELSHNWRLEILRSVEAGEKRHTELSQSLGVSPQETTRHLQRLLEMSLISKNREGCYGLTRLGRLTLGFLPGLEVVSRHPRFFLTHDTGVVPREFLLRLGDLAGGEVAESDSLATLNRALRTVQGSSGEVRVMAGGVLNSLGQLLDSGGVERRLFCVLPESQASGLRGLDDRCVFLPEVHMSVLLTDELGALCLPDAEGRIDYSSILRGTDEAFRGWCRDLFDYYFRRGRRS